MGAAGERMELRTALKISAGAHGALVVWAVAAGWFSSDFDEALEVTNVSLISGAEFAALVEEAGARAPSLGDQLEAVAPPRPRPEIAPEVTPEPEAAVEAAPESERVSEPEVAVVSEPEIAEPAPELPTEQASPEPSEVQELAEEPGDTPTPAPRVAPTAAERPDPNVAVAPEAVAAAEPVETEEAPEPQEAPEAAAPEEATTRIVTEATETGGAEEIALAPVATPRPPARPARAPEAEAPGDAAPEVAETAPAAEDALDAAVADALAEAIAGGGATRGDPGPPMTAGERDALRLAVQECWVVDVGSEAANVTVVVAMAMSPEGRVVDGSLRMLEASGGSDAAVRTAFQSARRAILRCQRDGFALPAEKYAQWQEVEMVFNPSEMRVR